MSQSAAVLLARVAAGYLGLGLSFALLFAWRWAGRLDPVAASGTIGFRLLLLPGATLLWPWLLWRVVRSRAGEAP